MTQEITRRQLHQLDHMQTICTSLHTANYTSAASITQSFTGQMLFLMPNQQCHNMYLHIYADQMHHITLYGLNYT